MEDDLQRKQAAPAAHNASIHAIGEQRKSGRIKKERFERVRENSCVPAKTKETASDVSDVQKFPP